MFRQHNIYDIHDIQDRVEADLYILLFTYSYSYYYRNISKPLAMELEH